MNCFKLMMDEHRNIEKILKMTRQLCRHVLETGDVPYEAFEKAIDFIRFYADKHHHGKEEKLLFTAMMQELGPLAEKLVRHGMQAEHEIGRLHIHTLKEALQKAKDGDNDARLDIIGHAIAYTHLLQQHIEKEDQAVYTFAAKKLKPETIAILEERCLAFEKEAAASGTQDYYLKLINELENAIATMN